MALAFLRVLETADAIKAVSDEAVRLRAKIETVLAFNSDQAIDWNGDMEEPQGSKPDYIDEDADGNIDGRRYSRSDVANAVYSLLQIQNVLDNVDPAQGDHLGNLNKLAQALPIR